MGEDTTMEDRSKQPPAATATATEKASDDNADKKQTVSVLDALRANASQLESSLGERGGAGVPDAGANGSADVAAVALQSGHGGGALRVIGQVLRSTAALKKRGWKLRDGVAFTKELVERGRKATGADAKTLEGLEEAAKALEAVMATSTDGDGAEPMTTDDEVAPAPQKKKPVGVSAEVEMYAYLVAVMMLMERKEYPHAVAVSSLAVSRVTALNRRSLDALSARVFFYYSWSHECVGRLDSIRGTLLALHRTATLRHDAVGLETLLNLIMRNYLHYNLYDQAEKFRAKSQRPDSHSNQQYCRYLFYLGKIRAAMLEYSEARDCLQQAVRKAPSAAHGFCVVANKWLVIVRLLLGDVPERTLFRARGFRRPLAPYLELTQAVRAGDLQVFGHVTEKHAKVFEADGTRNLIVRLRHNVIRAGLRNIHLAYSKISLADVAARLGLSEVEDTEFIVAKAIRDGGISASIDHDSGCMLSNANPNVYSTSEPLEAFHNRICFMLNVHNESVKAMRYPADFHKDHLETAEERKERLAQEQELAAVIAEEEDDDMI